jgi:capsular polysaccharide biosynthesis protein
VEPYCERIEDFLRRWRSRYEGDRVFRVLVITVVLAAYAVTSASLQQAPTYEASAQVWVDPQQGDQQTYVTRSGEEIQPPPPSPSVEKLQELTQTMVHAIESRPVAEEVIQRLGLQMKPAELLDNLTVEQIEGTSFIVLTYEDTDPERARLIVNTVGEVFSEFISNRSSEFSSTVWEKAAIPTTPASPHPLRNGLLTLVIGLVLCVGTVVVRPGVGARMAGALNEWGVRPIGEAELPVDPSIVERIKEKELLRALGRRGKLTAVEAALATSLSVEEANRMLFDLAARGHLELTVEHGKLLYSFWEAHGA